MVRMVKNLIHPMGTVILLCLFLQTQQILAQDKAFTGGIDTLDAELEYLREAIMELQEKQEGLLPVYDHGFTLRSEDGDFQLNIGGSIQPRYEFSIDTDASDTLSSFYMRRVRLDLRGHVFTNRLTFRITPELARTANLRDGFINYSLLPLFQIRAGQFTLPFDWHRSVGGSRQHFSERGIQDLHFAYPTGRDIGFGLHGQSTNRKFGYGGGVFDGAGRNSQLSTSSGNVYSARVTFATLGTIPREESDLTFSRQINHSIGIGIQAANKNYTRDWALGLSTNNRADWATANLDTRIAYRGISVVANGLFREVRPDDENVDPYAGWAYLVTGGVFIIPQRLEAVGRWSQLRIDKDSVETEESEWGAGINIYHRGYNWKTRINLLRHETSFAERTRLIIEHHTFF
ncbi:hypothetical protein CHISP_0193 [Chitinispirillum alkaliphilum]|nr:hypothetical protein CHISP_0193 [Chitinispirillum alkaliphilum]